MNAPAGHAGDRLGLLTAAQEIVPLLRAESDQNERERHLTDAAATALRDVGAFRLFVPSVYGGPECDPVTALDTISLLAEADASSAWCAGIASLTSHTSCVLEPSVAREIFGDPDAVACGAFAPNGRGTRVAGGWKVDGRWSWGSGMTHATWMTGGTITEDRAFHQMFFRRDEITPLDTWYSSGLCGTGSHDFEVQGAFVPEGRSVVLTSAKPAVDAPIARVSTFTLFCGGIAAVMIGIARRSIAEIIQLADVKKPAQSSRTLAQSPIVQNDVARAEVAVRASYSLLRDELATVWDTVLRGDRVPLEQRLRVRLAAAHVGTEACRAVDLCYNAGGGSSVYSTSPLQRCFRDVHTASAHIQVSPRSYETVGRHRLGLDIDASMI